MDNITHRKMVEMFKHFPIDETGYVPDEIPYSDYAILRNLLESRASLIEQRLSAGQKITELAIQTLDCVEVEEMDRNECPCAPASGCYWLKVKEPLPKPIQIISVAGIVAQPDMPRFTPIKWDRMQYIPQARYASTAKGRYYSILTFKDKETHMYLYGDRYLETIRISGFWEDPMYTAAFKTCKGRDMDAYCDPLDVEFYTDATMREEIVSLTWQRLLSARQAASLDPRNDDTGGRPLTNTK